MTDNAKQPDARQERLRAARDLLRGCLQTKAGMDIPEMLTVVCNVYPLKMADTHETYYRLGMMEVITQIQRIGEAGNE